MKKQWTTTGTNRCHLRYCVCIWVHWRRESGKNPSGVDERIPLRSEVVVGKKYFVEIETLNFDHAYISLLAIS